MSSNVLGVGVALWLSFLCWPVRAAETQPALQPSEGYPWPRFGEEVRSKYFQFGQGFLNFNHGGFGATPKPVRQAMEVFTDRMEAQPTQWFGGNGYRAILEKVRPMLARLIGSSSSDLVFLDNASAGLTAVLRGLAWKRGDILLITNAAYAVIPNTADWLEKQYGIRTLQVHIQYPVSGAETYIDPVRQLLSSLSPGDVSRVRLAIFDHISSYPAVVLPVMELARLVKQATRGQGLVMLDGAHALGQIAIDMQQLEESGVDFWVGDGHKWLFSPRGSAVLWAARAVQALLEPDVISSDNPPGTAFQERFDYIGTRDYTPWCAMEAALAFRNATLGGDLRIFSYVHNLAVWAGAMLAAQFRTEVLAPSNMTAAMTNVRLPIPLSWPVQEQQRCAEAVGNELVAQYNMQVIPFTLQTISQDGGTQAERETHWVRISAQVYLEEADFHRLSSSILSIVATCSHETTSSLEDDILQV